MALQHNLYSDIADEEWYYALQQIDGCQRATKKLPTLSQIKYWQFPARLSLEQCSSEQTAIYKRKLLEEYINARNTLADLTGGYGIDTWFLSDTFATTHYVERQTELSQIAKHNFALSDKHILVHNSDATEFLNNATYFDCIYLDPARRSMLGSKVFRLEDCEPDITLLYPTLMIKCEFLLLKLSPMLDITAALNRLPNAVCVSVVAVENEVKELLILCKSQPEHISPVFRAINIINNATQVFEYKLGEEQNAICRPADNISTYIYEPNAAIMKAGAFRIVGQRYNICKLSENTHLYTSNQLINEFQGRVWKVNTVADKKSLKDMRLSIVSRNYPLSAEQIRVKYKIKEGDTDYLIATKAADKNYLLLAERIY